MVLAGRVNKSLVTLIQQAGGRAVGLCGKDSNILQARQMVEKDIGFVGEVTRVGTAVQGAAHLQHTCDGPGLGVLHRDNTRHHRHALSGSCAACPVKLTAGASAL